MKKTYLLCILFIYINAGAQPDNKDSLYRLILTKPEDTSTINAYYEYGYIYENINLDSAAYFFLKGKAIADKYHHIKGQIKFARYYSDVLNLRGDLDSSYLINKQALDLALQYKLPVEIGKTYANVGNVFNHQGRYDSAVYYYMQSAAAFEKAGELRYVNILYQNLGTVFDQLKQYRKAIEYADKSITLSRQQGDSFTVSSVLVNKAGSLTSLKEYDAALAILQQAIALCRQINNPYNEELAYISMGNVYAQLKQYDKGLECFKKALIIIRQQGFTSDESTALNGLAMTYFKAGNYPEADDYARQAIAISKETGVLSDLLQQYKLAADINAHLQRHAAAYDYLQQYVQLNDSLTNATVTNTVQELEKKYETARKDKAIADQNLQLAIGKAELKRKQTWLIVLVTVIILMSAIFYTAYKNHRNKRKLQEQQIVSLQQEAEMIRLKATLEGQLEERQRIAKEIHDDIGSGLTSIVFLGNTANGDNAKVTKITNTARQLVTQMNEIVWSMSTDQDKLEDLVAYLRHNISEMLNTVNMDYYFNIPDHIPDITIGGIQRRNIYLAVKEAVHNCIKHAEATKVTVSMGFTDGITIKIEDNGKGIGNEVVRKFGNGMKNMQYRLEKTGGSFKIVNHKPLAIEMNVPSGSIL